MRKIVALVLMICMIPVVSYADAASWICELCGVENDMNFCGNCGEKKTEVSTNDMQEAYAQKIYEYEIALIGDEELIIQNGVDAASINWTIINYIISSDDMSVFYSLYDVNNDGIQELIFSDLINIIDIYTMDGNGIIKLYEDCSFGDREHLYILPDGSLVTEGVNDAFSESFEIRYIDNNTKRLSEEYTVFYYNTEGIDQYYENATYLDIDAYSNILYSMIDNAVFEDLEWFDVLDIEQVADNKAYLSDKEDELISNKKQFYLVQEINIEPDMTIRDQTYYTYNTNGAIDNYIHTFDLGTLGAFVTEYYYSYDGYIAKVIGGPQGREQKSEGEIIEVYDTSWNKLERYIDKELVAIYEYNDQNHKVYEYDYYLDKETIYIYNDDGYLIEENGTYYGENGEIYGQKGYKLVGIEGATVKLREYEMIEECKYKDYREDTYDENGNLKYSMYYILNYTTNMLEFDHATQYTYKAYDELFE